MWRKDSADSLRQQRNELLCSMPNGRKSSCRSQFVPALGIGLAAHARGARGVDAPLDVRTCGKPSAASALFSARARLVSRGALRQIQHSSHAFVVGAAAAFGDYPVDDLVGIGDVAGFAVHAVGGVDLKLESIFFLHGFVDGGGTKILAGIAVLDGATVGANV